MTGGYKMAETSGLKALGAGQTTYGQTYDPSVLEAFPNPHEEAGQVVTLECPEFTSLCQIWAP